MLVTSRCFLIGHVCSGVRRMSVVGFARYQSECERAEDDGLGDERGGQWFEELKNERKKMGVGTIDFGKSFYTCILAQRKRCPSIAPNCSGAATLGLLRLSCIVPDFNHMRTEGGLGLF